MKNDLPLYKSNPELFKIHLLDNSLDEISIVNGLTEEDRILAMEIKLGVSIKFFVQSSSIFNKCTKTIILADIRRKVKRILHSYNGVITKKHMLSNTNPSLFKANPRLFEKFVLQSFLVRPCKEKIKGITQNDRNLRIEITTRVLFDEIVKLLASIRNQSVNEVQDEMNQDVEKILSGYERLLNIENRN